MNIKLTGGPADGQQIEVPDDLRDYRARYPEELIYTPSNGYAPARDLVLRIAHYEIDHQTRTARYSHDV